MTHIEYIIQLVTEGKLDEALKSFLQGVKLSGQPDVLNNLVLLSSRFRSNECDYHNSIIYLNDYKIERAKIANALLEWLKDYVPKGDFIISGTNNVIEDSDIVETVNYKASKPGFTIEIIIQGNLNNIGEKEKGEIIDYFKNLLRINSDQNPIYLKAGSIIISIENLTQEQVEKIKIILKQLINFKYPIISFNIKKQVKKIKANNIKSTTLTTKELEGYHFQLNLMIEKKLAFEKEQIITYDAEKKFALKKQIKELVEHINILKRKLK